jgi:hypothetical protein
LNWLHHCSLISRWVAIPCLAEAMLRPFRDTDQIKSYERYRTKILLRRSIASGQERPCIELHLFRIGLETVFDCVPVNIGEKRFDVFGAFSGFIVEQERVFPNVHHQQRLESRHTAYFM